MLIVVCFVFYLISLADTLKTIEDTLEATQLAMKGNEARWQKKNGGKKGELKE